MIYEELSALFPKNIADCRAFLWNGLGNSAALVYEDRVVQKHEIDELSKRWHNYLLANNPNRAPIALMSDKEPWSYSLMLGCLEFGCAFVNLDPMANVLRNKDIHDDLSPMFVVFAEKYSDQAKELGAISQECRLVRSDAYRNEPQIRDSELRKCQIDGDTIAYFMFTSGSTGKPKGVAITHNNLLQFVCWGLKSFKITKNDIFAGLSPKHFDNSVFDFFVGLIGPGAIAPIQQQELQHPLSFLKKIERLGVTVWFSVPSLLVFAYSSGAFRAVSLSKLRHFIFGGEGFPISILKRIFDDYEGQAKFTNVYGPTEGTCICTEYVVSQIDFEKGYSLMPIGKVLPHFDYEIIGDNGMPDETGELLIMGPSVGRGYVGADERSSEKFTNYTGQHRFNKTCYHTGDLVRRDGDLLHFLGRSDNQIKFMGYRIELEEVESTANSLEPVAQSACVFLKRDIGGSICLAVELSHAMSEKQLRQRLQERLPEYMQPKIIKVVGQLPKNRNGKVDRASVKKLFAG